MLNLDTRVAKAFWQLAVLYANDPPLQQRLLLSLSLLLTQQLAQLFT